MNMSTTHKEQLSNLNKLITIAILHSERLDDQSPEFLEVVAEISSLEEQIASLTQADSVQGLVAREGAIRAAITCGNITRATTLAKQYIADPKLPEKLRTRLEQFIHDQRAV